MPDGIVVVPAGGETKTRKTVNKDRKMAAKRRMADRTAIMNTIHMLNETNGEYPETDIHTIKTVLSDMSQKMANEIVEILSAK
jgi:NADH:ubiquinone oxidoreductase subunit E